MGGDNTVSALRSQPILTRKERAVESHYLDVLRGAAALTVVVSHADHAGLLALGLDNSLKSFLGNAGVYLFFMLSGFLIWRSAQGIRQPNGLRIYGIHRATGLLPLYFVNIAFVVLVLPHLESAFQPQVTLETLVRHLTLTQSLNPSVSRALNPVLWTLTHEAIFYALVPLLLFVRTTFLPAIGAMAIILSWQPSTVSSFLAVFHLFVIGMLMAERRMRSAIATLVALIVVQSAAGLHATEELVAEAVAGALFMVSRLAPNRGLWISLPLRWVGVISYSLYIWHYLFINLLGTQGGLRAMYTLTDGLSANDGVRGVLFIAMALAISTVSYFLIERPGMGWLRQGLLSRLCPAAPQRPAA